mgnify:CR=1 FL=1
MIVDVRRYTLKPGKLAPYLEQYGSLGYKTQSKHLGSALGWFISDVGPQNHVMHLWGYSEAADMERKRSSMASDPAWVEIRKNFKGLFAAQETEIMRVIPNLPFTSAANVPGLVDIRFYTLHHGQLQSFLDFLVTRSALIQARHWTDNIIYLVSQSGYQNRIMHIWGHSNHAERLSRRGSLLADPDWQDCMKTFLPMFEDMRTFTAIPATFWKRQAMEVNYDL